MTPLLGSSTKPSHLSQLLGFQPLSTAEVCLTCTPFGDKYTGYIDPTVISIHPSSIIL